LNVVASGESWVATDAAVSGSASGLGIGSLVGIAAAVVAVVVISTALLIWKRRNSSHKDSKSGVAVEETEFALAVTVDGLWADTGSAGSALRDSSLTGGGEWMEGDLPFVPFE
jgi:hypothetical protein